MKDGAIIGGAVGALFSALRQTALRRTDPERPLDWGEMLAYGAIGAGVGAASATLPDLLEPAIHPNHRKFFHSVTAGGLALYGAKNGHEAASNDALKVASLSAGAGYAIHLIADSVTPFSVSLI